MDSVVIGNNVSLIGYGAFQGCTNLVKIVLPHTIDSIGPYVFSGCTSLTKIIMPNSCRGIAEGTFYGCTNLTTANVSDNIETVGEQAFYNCTNLDTLYIGVNVRTIGGGAFAGCSRIRYLHFNAKNCQTHFMRDWNAHVPSIFGNYTSQDSLNTLIIGDSVLNIVENAFGRTSNYNNNIVNVHSITIPENVQTIGLGAFIGLTNLDTIYYNAKTCRQMRGSLTLPPNVGKIIVGNSVQRLPDSAFYGMTNVFDSVPWPDSIRYVGQHCYDGHSNIVGAVTIPSTIDTIDDYAFANCTGIDTIIFNTKNCMKMNSGKVFEGCNNISYIEIGNNVQRFPDSAFTVFNHLLDTIPWRNSLRYVGAWNFPNRNELSGNFTIPQSVDTIAEGAFYNCDNILSLNTNNVKCLGRRAFADCDRLISVTLGNPAQILGSGAFNGCFRLQTIDFGGVTTIGDSAFNGCVRLENPELPATLTSIGTRAFNGCCLLAGKLTFPATITTIGNYAYRNIGTITEIEMLGSNPPTIYASTFYSVSNSTPVSVPCGAVMSYYTTNYWENFSTIVEAPPYRLIVESNNEIMGSAAVSQQPTCSNHSAIIQATAETGFHFLQWSDGNGTNPRTVNMTQDSSYTAVFVPNNSQVTIVPNDPLRGTTTGSGTYGWNAPVTMTATAYDGYHFLKWNDGNTQNPRYMAAVRDTTFTAIFVSNVSTITVGNANPDWGNVSGSGVYYYMNLVSLTATPVYGYHFSQWNDGNTQNPRTITVIQDSSFTAYFAVNTYSIVGSSNSTAMGSVTGGGTYTYLHEMSLTATPAFGYHFVQWNDQNTDNPRTITVTRDSAFTAQFAANSYAITAEPNDPTMGSAYGSG
ncbi:MAG: leucine-rich repeat protein, partial [Bacteroidales bacterium]|nr:leucine-rich repeat protein [Bacteroidales bacterium]